MVLFYIDTCIYINLWHKEGNESLGVPYWQLALNFLNKYSNSKIYFSGFVLKELKYILSDEEFKEKRKVFYKINFCKLESTSEDISQARKIESEINFEISFYDIIHMLLAKRSNSILITRDKKLLLICKKYNILAGKPEDFL